LRRPTNVKQAELRRRGDQIRRGQRAAGKWARSATAAGKIELIDLAAGKKVKTLEGHSARLRGSILDDGTKLLSGSQDKSLRLWNAADGNLIGEFDTPAPVNAVAFLAGNEQIASAHADNLIPRAAVAEQAEGRIAAAAPRS